MVLLLIAFGIKTLLITYLAYQLIKTKQDLKRVQGFRKEENEETRLCLKYVEELYRTNIPLRYQMLHNGAPKHIVQSMVFQINNYIKYLNEIQKKTSGD